MNKTKVTEKIAKNTSAWSFLTAVNLKNILVSIIGFINGVLM